MRKPTLAYVKVYRDRHGKLRRYFRRPGFKAVSLPGLPGSAEFMEVYQAALEGTEPPTQIGASRTIAGSVNALVADYLTVLPHQHRRSRAARRKRSARAGIFSKISARRMVTYRSTAQSAVSACCCSRGNICSVL